MDKDLALSGPAWASDSVWGLDCAGKISQLESRGLFLKAGGSETRKGLAKRKQQESLGWAALGPWEVRERGTSETDSGDQPGTSCQLPIALEFR